LGEILITGNAVVLTMGGIILFCMVPKVRRAVATAIKPFQKAMHDAIEVLDEDGDGDVSIFELLSASKEKRKTAMHDLMHGISETAQNFEDLALHQNEGDGGTNPAGEDRPRRQRHRKRKKERKKQRKKQQATEDLATNGSDGKEKPASAPPTAVGNVQPSEPATDWAGGDEEELGDVEWL
jgi:hypothetical protein